MSTITFEDYVSRDALGLAELVASGQVSAAELAETAIARAEAVNPAINAVAFPLYDQARAAAAGGGFTGPFAGVPWAVKDLGHAIAGVPVTGGSKAFEGYVSPQDSEMVTRFRAAGLNIVCTTTSPELGLTTTTESTLFGLTRNPWDLERSSGGSSGGASALVAAGVMPAAHATDGGGSIRIPAACCGLFGLKVSRGRNPVGVDRTEGWLGLGVSHAVTRSVRDSAALLDASHGPEVGSRYVAQPPEGTFLEAAGRAPGRLRIAVQKRAGNGAPLHPEVVAALEKAAALFAGLGHTVDEAEPDLDYAALARAMGAVVGVSATQAMRRRAEQLGISLDKLEMEEVTRAFVAISPTVTAETVLAANDLFMTSALTVARFQQAWDVILTPTLAQPPALLGKLSLAQPAGDYGAAIGAYSPFTALQNQTGQPAANLPLHWSADGLPIGVQIVGRNGDEATLLSLAAQAEQASPWFDRRAPLGAA